MKLFQVILILTSACLIQTASAKDSLGKYQQLSLNLNELCHTQVTERELIKAFRKAGGLRATGRPTFVKTNTINFPQHVRLKILKDGNWDLMTEEYLGDIQWKTEHYARSNDYQMFAFVNAKKIEPSAVTKTDRPTMVVFTPHRVIVVATEYKRFYLLNSPDLEFAKIKYRSQPE